VIVLIVDQCPDDFRRWWSDWYVLKGNYMSGTQDMESIDMLKATGRWPGIEKPSDSNLDHFTTGAVRSKDANGTAYTLISPIGLRRVAETCAEGAEKYGDYNWEKGMPIRDLLDHGIRHLYLFLEGDRGEDHLAHAAWNLLAAMHSEEKWPELNKNLRRPGCELPSEV
jgi:hypothetical protein